KVTLTNGDIWNLQRPLAELVGKPMPTKYGFRLQKLGNAINAELRDISKAQNALVEKFGVKDEDDKSPTKGQVVVKKDSPKRAEFDKEITDLLSLTCEMEVEKVSLPDTLEVPAAILMALKDFLLDPEEDAVAEAEKIVKNAGK
ncbi:MAG: hypothetical protein KJ954_14305, partial [Alphaproteobacteria bacterium]|nr:hypothetical protein [Alphaproteobacteria bacterium]